MSNLYRLVYTSSRKAICTDEEIDKILASCQKNNPGRDITGILMHSEKRFLQYIEGNKEDLEELYDLILKDPRHAGVNKRDFVPIEERLFPVWSMGYKDLSREKIEFNTEINDKDKRWFEQLIYGDEFIPERGMRLLKTFFDMA